MTTAVSMLERNIIHLAKHEYEEFKMFIDDDRPYGREMAANAGMRGLALCEVSHELEHGLTEKGAEELKALEKKIIDALAEKNAASKS